VQEASPRLARGRTRKARYGLADHAHSAAARRARAHCPGAQGDRGAASEPASVPGAQMTCRHCALAILGVGAAAVIGLFALGYVGGLRINLTSSYPLGIWRIV